MCQEVAVRFSSEGGRIEVYADSAILWVSGPPALVGRGSSFQQIPPRPPRSDFHTSFLRSGGGAGTPQLPDPVPGRHGPRRVVTSAPS